MFQEMITARQQVWSSDFSRSYSIAHRNKQRKRCAGFSPLQLPFVPTRGRTPNASAIRKAKRTKVRAPKNLRGARGETRPALRFMERLLSFFRMHGRSGRRPRLENARRRFRRAGRSALLPLQDSWRASFRFCAPIGTMNHLSGAASFPTTCAYGSWVSPEDFARSRLCVSAFERLSLFSG